jgi:hypothetical protein
MKSICYSSLSLPNKKLHDHFVGEIIPYVNDFAYIDPGGLLLDTAMGTYCDIIKKRNLQLVNAYYDIVTAVTKEDPTNGYLVPGCTAFAIDAPGGPIHGRNLDWASPDDLLAKEAVVIRHGYYDTIGWEGLDACFTGMKPGAFSVSLNAVVSEAPIGLGGIASPIALRTALDKHSTFEGAVHYLSNVKILTDCLIMVVGNKPGQMVVIERTPTKYCWRGPENGILVLTNDYRIMDGELTGIDNTIINTSCSRYERVMEIAKDKDPMEVLTDDKVIIPGMTAYHTVMQPGTGDLQVKESCLLN